MSKLWRATVFTLFPEWFPGPLGHSVIGRALTNGIASVKPINIRDFATDRHRTVDDSPFGGGAGMVMRPDVLDAALAYEANLDGGQVPSLPEADDRPLLMLSPRGEAFTQSLAHEWAESPGLRLICGRYEGVDQRVLDKWQVREVSLGDYIITGGELAAMVILDACMRLLPGVVGQPDSLHEESFSSHLLEYPHYTRPAEWQGMKVPSVLQTGHHAAIDAWRLAEAEALTKARRPDLWQIYQAERAQSRALSRSLSKSYSPLAQ